jgi:hypothetical protein
MTDIKYMLHIWISGTDVVYFLNIVLSYRDWGFEMAALRSFFRFVTDTLFWWLPQLKIQSPTSRVLRKEGVYSKLSCCSEGTFLEYPHKILYTTS